MIMAGVTTFQPKNDEERRRDELSPLSIIQHLRDPLAQHFVISAHWTLLLRLLGVSSNDVHKRFIDAKTDSTDIEHHFEDGLNVWLKQDVSQSWQKIDGAVDYIKEHKSATVVFRLLWPEISIILSQAEDIIQVKLIGTLEDEHIIKIDRNSDISLEQLFDLLCAFIEENPNHNLMKLFNIFTSHFSCFKNLTALFEVECKICFVELPRAPEPSIAVPLSPLLKGEFDEVIEYYNLLIANIIEDISERLKTDTELDFQLKRHLINSGKCNRCKDTDSTLTYLRVYMERSSSVTNMKPVKRICQKYGSRHILKDLEEYENCYKDLCTSELTADKLIGKPLSKIETTEGNKITFTVKWEIEETELNQIQELLYFGFKSCGSAIHIINVRRGNSFTVTCYAPESIIGLLIHKAQKNLALLKEKGVIFLKIGYCTLLDHKRKYEINTEFIHDDPRNEIKELKAQNENLQSEIKQLQMTLEEHEIDLPPHVKTDDTTTVDLSELSLEDKAKLKLIEMEFSDTAGKLPIDSEFLPVEVEVLEIDDHSDTTKHLASKLLDADDDSLPEEPVKMKPPFEVDKGQENVVISVIEDEIFDELETRKQDKERGEPNLMDKKIKNMLKEIDQLRDEKISMSGELLKLKDKNDSLESNLKEIKESSIQQQSDMQLKRSVLESRIPTLHDGGHDQYPPVEILMTQYSKRKSMYEHWYSPSFYTHPGGYKLCVKMVPCGQDKGEGTHLSLYVHVMSGDHDDRLPWPFMGVIKLQLRNRRGDHDHWDLTIVYDENTKLVASGRVESGPMTPSGTAALIGRGNAQWIKNEDLQYNSGTDTLYLKDDALIIRVNEVIVDHTRVPPVLTPPTTDDTMGGATPAQYIAEIRVPNFDMLRENSKSWESEGFYTGPNESGYKFLLAVHPNGKDQYKGQRVSVYTHLMKGKNDDNLRFPFRGGITVQLVNQRENKNHVEHQITYTKEGDQFGWRGGRIRGLSFSNRLAGRSYGGWGYAGFVKHEYLPYNKANNTQYLTDNNELVFRITKVEYFY